MRKLPKWLLPLCTVLVLIAGIFFADQFSVKPEIFVSGEIRLKKELLEDARKNRTLFLTVFDADSPMPMPYGALRKKIKVESADKITNFVITPENLQIMNRDRPIPRNLRVKARLDRDGQGGRDQPGDLFGILESIPYGTSGTVITIDQLISEE